MKKRSEIKFIKPCIHEGEQHHKLTPEYTNMCAVLGKLVQINLDNCSIQRMEELPLHASDEDAKKVGLMPLVELLRYGSVALTAIGINEMPDIHVNKALRAYQAFCNQFWPQHTDDIEATFRDVNTLSEDKKVTFTELSDSARCTYGISYVAMLQIQNIQLNYSHKCPIEQFEIYIHSMTSMLDLITAYDMEIAKYAFWQQNSNQINQLPESVRLRRKNLKNNFYKLAGNLDKARWFSFDAAMDLHWLSGANLAENLGADIDINGNKVKVEQWVGTNDHKLFSICQDIHSVYVNGQTMRQLAASREDALSTQIYWQSVDGIANSILAHRFKNRTEQTKSLLSRIDNAVRQIEAELKGGFKN